MPFEHFPEDPALRLEPGTLLGCWRVVERQGFGGYGIVYRARRVGQERSDSVALKLARYPWDRRFAREAELLSRIHHASVPRLYDQGVWRLASGVEHSYLVMEWVDGTPLYEWGSVHAPSPGQMLRLVAQLARALAATHAAQALHRDVKGDNIRVRHVDGRAVLMDFGSGHFQGAARLTSGSLPPGTDEYRSPAAWLFHLNTPQPSEDCFEATPADDLFALGVTVYRLVTGGYPPRLMTLKNAAGGWRVLRDDPRPDLEHQPRLDPLLREWILRLLSLSPEERGTAVELAEALEDAAARGEAPAPVVQAVHVTPLPAEEAAPPNRTVHHEPARPWSPWHAMAAVGLGALFVWTLLAVVFTAGDVAVRGMEACASDAPASRAVAVGDLPLEPPASAHPPSEHEAVAQAPLPEPHPGQVRTDKKGKCPGRRQVPLNGACWVEQPSATAEECKEDGYAYYKDRCYAPTVDPPKKPQPTSSPADSR
jgi:tRNA A-37 threonylcarbamoyl transferase component Bud32